MSPQDVADKILTSPGDVEEITLAGDTITTRRHARMPSLAVDLEADRLRRAEREALELEKAAR